VNTDRREGQFCKSCKVTRGHGADGDGCTLPGFTPEHSRAMADVCLSLRI